MLDFGKDLDIMVGNTLGDGFIFGLLYLRDGNNGLLTAIDDFTPDFSENPENDYPNLSKMDYAQMITWNVHCNLIILLQL